MYNSRIMRDELKEQNQVQRIAETVAVAQTQPVSAFLPSGNQAGPIAVFDSGLGGISVLRALRRLMPAEDFLYFGDSANAPYGTKTQEELLARCETIVNALLARGAKCVVVACNTATSAAVPALRRLYPGLPIIGMEPAVKPAATEGGHPRVLVMATPVTIHGERLHQLVQTYDQQAEILLLEAPQIVNFVESGESDAHPTKALRAYLHEILQPYLPETGTAFKKLDAIVLGCTHFPFVRHCIQETLPYAVELFDGAEGTARQTRRRLKALGALRQTGQGKVQMENSDPGKLSLAWSLLGEGEGKDSADGQS